MQLISVGCCLLIEVGQTFFFGCCLFVELLQTISDAVYQLELSVRLIGDWILHTNDYRDYPRITTTEYLASSYKTGKRKGVANLVDHSPAALRAAKADTKSRSPVIFLTSFVGVLPQC